MLNAELNPICYLLALLGAHHFLHVSRIGVKVICKISASHIVDVVCSKFLECDAISTAKLLLLFQT
jgi:hypothetical protein